MWECELETGGGPEIRASACQSAEIVWHDSRVTRGMSLRLRRAFAQVLLLGLLPLGIASASAEPFPQTPPYGRVQITRDKVDIRCIGRNKEKCMTATKGTVLEVLFVEGDRYNHRNSNWYWVLLPP